jgi:hypothetical protein
VNLAQVMGVVVIAALDCGLVRLILSRGDELGAACAVGLSVSLVLIGVVLTRGALGPFGAGFAVSALLAAVLTLVAVSGLHPMCGKLWNDYYNAVILWLPPSLVNPQEWQPVDDSGITRPGLTPRGAVICVVVAGIPPFTAGLVGGLLALAIRRRPRSTPAPDPITA